MKYFFLLFLIPMLGIAANGLIEEEVYIQGSDESLVKLIQSNPALTIDHRSLDGFELYGPVGMKKWLSNIGASFTALEDGAHKHIDDVADYPSFEQVEKNLRSYVALNPKIAKMFSIGKSNKGRDLWVVKISDNVEIDEVEPEFKYISSMHGNEITGRELTQFLIRDIITGYGKDKTITDLVNNTELYIMPSMNPDGSQRRVRANDKGYDLNRNFPDWLRKDENTGDKRQVETQAVMKFQASRNFSLSANFHGGDVVVNYPWDNTYEKHPLDKFVRELSVEYSKLNPPMYSSRSFQDGVTNGADWYVVAGGMQDWSYFFHNDLQVTVELSHAKWPRYSEIPNFYKDNKDSMLTYASAIHQGMGFSFGDQSVTGKVKVTELVNNKTIDHGNFGFDKGEFYKVLPLGEFTFSVETSTGKKHTIQKTISREVADNGGFISL